MKFLFFSLSLGLLLAASFSTLTEGTQETSSTPVLFAEFFDQFKGNYRILLAGTEVPKEENKYGSVSLEETEGLLVFPYCHKNSGVCDPGFRSFFAETAKISKKEISPDHVVYTLESFEKEKPRQYTWEFRNKTVHFLDPEYTLVNGESYPLEFVAEKIPSLP